MKMINNNKKLIIGFLFGIILASTLSVCAYSYFAENIGYTKDGTEITNVKQALNDLYGKVNKEQSIFYNGTINKMEATETGYTGFSSTHDVVEYGGKNCLYFDFSESNGGWSCHSGYKSEEVNISQYKTICIDYAKIYSETDGMGHFIKFLDSSGNTIDTICFCDTAINEENKKITINLGIVPSNAKYFEVDASTGINKGNIYNCLVKGQNAYVNGVNGEMYAYIREIYLEK